MSNLFLPPFPEEGLTQDYIDSINNIFAVFAGHNHTTSGNRIQSDAINWDTSVNASDVQDTYAVSFVTSASSGSDSSLYSYNQYSDLYFKKAGVATPIQLTNKLFVNYTSVAVGITGPTSPYSVELAYSSVSNSYTFSYINGLLNIFAFTLSAGEISTPFITANSLSLVSAPNIAPLNGYLYYNEDGALIYSANPIRTNGSTVANAYIFDNLTTYYTPPEGFGATYTNPSTNFITLLRYLNISGGTISKNYFVNDVSWFPIVANDELVSGNVKQAFYCEPFTTSPNAFNAQEIYHLSDTSERWVWSLTNQQSYSLSTRIMHYTFALNSGSTVLTYWNDCLLENTTQSGTIEKFILMDLQGTPSAIFGFGMKFNFIYDTGVIPV